jgi:hypothetical protein
MQQHRKTLEPINAVAPSLHLQLKVNLLMLTISNLMIIFIFYNSSRPKDHEVLHLSSPENPINWNNFTEANKHP